MNTSRTPTNAPTVVVDVADPDLDADVRAVLAALSLEARRGDAGPADVVVTDRPEVTVPAGAARVVRVASDEARLDDDAAAAAAAAGSIPLPSGTARLVSALSAPVDGAGALIVVVGAVGGAGTSTVATALAVRAAGEGRVLLVEADPRGQGLDLLLGLESQPGLRVEDVRSELGGPDPGALWSAVPAAVPGCGVLARARDHEGGPGPPGAGPGSAAVTGAILAHRGSGGLVVCDAGRADPDDPLPGSADLVVVVTRADLAGAVAARTTVTTIAGGREGCHLVVRSHRGDPVHAADVAGVAGLTSWDVVPELGAVRAISGAGDLATTLARGRGGRLRTLAAVADAVLAESGNR